MKTLPGNAEPKHLRWPYPQRGRIRTQESRTSGVLSFSGSKPSFKHPPAHLGSCFLSAYAGVKQQPSLPVGKCRKCPVRFPLSREKREALRWPRVRGVALAMATIPAPPQTGVRRPPNRPGWGPARPPAAPLLSQPLKAIALDVLKPTQKVAAVGTNLKVSVA